MKNSIVIGLLLLILINSCGKEKVQVLTPTEAEKKEISFIGQQVTGLLLKTLQGELMTAIEVEGVVGAITVCNERAIRLTDSLTQNISRVNNKIWL